jgi:hypothetical protein
VNVNTVSIYTQLDKALTKIGKRRPVAAPNPAMRRRLDDSELAEGVADCVEGYASVRKGGARIGIIAEESLFWQWAIGRFGVLAWTWLTKGDGYWVHPYGGWVHHPVSNDVAAAE